MADRELKITMSLSTGDVERKLDEFGRAADKATDRASHGLKDTERAAHGAAGGIKSMAAGLAGAGRELGQLIRAQIGLSAIKGAAEAMGDEMRRATEYTTTLARQFADVRAALVQVAALRGEQPSNKFTLEQTRKAASAGMLPEEFAKAQEAFLNPAAAQLEGPNAKMTREQADEYVTRVARLAKARNMDPSAAMEFAGSILEQSKGPISVNDAMKQFNEGFMTLERGRVDVRRGTPALSQIMAHGGISTREAASIYNVVAPASPGEEITAVEGALRAMEELRIEGKGQEFGVTDKMTKYQAFQAFGKNIAGRMGTLRAQGKTEEQIDLEIARQLKDAGVAQEIRERRGLARGIARQGVELRGFETYDAMKIAPDYDLAASGGFAKSDEGQAQRRAAEKALGVAERGKLRQGIQGELDEADIRLIKEGRYEAGHFYNAYVRGGIGKLTGVDPHQQQINEEALGALRKRARDIGARPAYRPGNAFTDPGILPRDTSDVKTRTQSDVDEEIRDLLRAIKVESEKQTRALEGQGQPQGPPPPMPATPTPRPARVQ